MTTEYIPPATARKLAEDFPVGTRHHEALNIAVPLVGNGMPGAVVFATLRSKFGPDVTDKELHRVVEWAESVHPTPSVKSNGGGNGSSYRPRPARAATEKVAEPSKERTPLEQADWWTSGARLTPEKAASRSPVKLPDDHVGRARLALGMLYKEAEHLNVVCKFTMDGPKANPSGGGKTMTRDQWLDWFGFKGVPSSEAGAWFRINPCKETGSGKGGAVTDADVTAWRYLLVESDSLPTEAQLALYTKLRLPVAALVSSAGKSVHAWVRLDSPSLDKYKETAKRVLEALKPFGIDQVNTNCSRLSRLPGAKRVIQASNGGVQELLWLNPKAEPLTDKGLDRLEASLKFPAIEDNPLHALALSSIDRYEFMSKNIGKLGVPTGVPEFDRVSGGMKAGQTIVVAGETGAGKSTFGLHLACSALDAGYGVSMFSLEMDREEIFDLMLSRRSEVDRNKFNTGEFSKEDIATLGTHLAYVAKLPLYIDDSALLSVDEIWERVVQLKDDGKVGLVIVDYIQFVNPVLTRDSREQQVAQISHGLRALAREVKLPMVVLSQLNEEGKLRESRVIAHNANIVMLVDLKGYEMKVKVVKGRGVPKGDYTLGFDAQFCRLVPQEAKSGRFEHQEGE